MRTRLQALLSSTALAAAIAGAALMSSGSVRYANADAVTDTVKEMMTAMMNSQGAALPEATRTAVGAVLNGTSDGAAMMAQLDSLAAQNAALAETIGSALGKASLSLQLSDPAAASQLHTFVSASSNAKMLTGYSAAQQPITAQNALMSSGFQVAQNLDGQNQNQNPDDLLNSLINGVNLNDIQPAGGGNLVLRGNNVVFVQQTFLRNSIQSVANFIAQTFHVGPYSV